MNVGPLTVVVCPWLLFWVHGANLARARACRSGPKPGCAPRSDGGYGGRSREAGLRAGCGAASAVLTPAASVRSRAAGGSLPSMWRGSSG